MKIRLIFFLFLIGPHFLFSLEGLDGLDGLISSSHDPGLYSDDIELSFSTLSDLEISYHFENSQDKTDVKYIFPLRLTAMSGESRKYSLIITILDGNEVLETKKYEYLIDKDIPKPPVLNKKDGLYNNSIKIEFNENEADIYYSIKSTVDNDFTLWNGETLDIQQNDSLNTESIRSYCLDSAGNRSSVQVNSFTILPAVEKHISLEVPSPVEGVFLNNQIIYIDTTGYKWIRYSFDDVDPESRGTSYISPVLLKKTGDYKLNIAALPLNTDKVLTKEIVFSIIDNQRILINKESGIYTEDISLKFNKNGMNYNLEEREVVAWDTILPDTIDLMPVPGVVKYMSLRIAEPAGNGEYRYFFILDKRIPAAPIISISSESPISTGTEVRILGVQGADLFYTTDGSTPDRYSAYYKRPFNIEIPENRNSGSLIIKAIAYFSDKSTSIVTSKLLTYDIKKPEKPELTITSTIFNKTSFSFSNYLSNRIIYTMTYDGSDPEDPVVTSFTGKQDMLLTIPHGIDTNVRMNAAYIDRAGNISDSVIFDLLKIDTVPPKEPEIIIKDQVLTLNGNGAIYYKIIINNNTDPIDYQLYESPFLIDIDESSFLKYIVSSYSVDESGNKSSIVASEEVIVDKRIPILPDYSGVSNGGLYNNPRSLRLHSSDDIKIYYTVSSTSTPPDDPIPGTSSRIDEYLYFDCPVNETREYIVKLVAAYNNYEIISFPEIVSFKIDRIAPRVPVITSVIDGKVYNEDVKINIKDKEDAVWILIKDQIEVEDLTFANFEANGILLNNGYTVRLEENREKQYQLSALSIDEAGNTNISREVVNFSIDKIPPEPPKIYVDNSLSEYILIRMSSKDLDDIIYEISYDGSYPEKPAKSSLIYQLPLQIQKENANSIYISARTIDPAGNISDLTSLEKINFTETYLEPPVIKIGKLNSAESSISFASLTGMRIYLKEGDSSFFEYIDPFIIDLRNRDNVDLFYYSMDNYGNKSSVAVSRIEKTSSPGNIITGITDNKIYNIGRVVWKSNESRVVRYEVAIDDEEPDNVTVFSPELTEPIVFDSVDGETLKVSMNVKEFMENVSVFEKHDSNYSFIIDKSNPNLPEVQGIVHDGFYQNDRLIELNSNEMVYYKVSTGINNLSSVDYKLYNQPIEISVDEGRYKQFNLEFYSKDSAGNLSDVKIMEFTIDKANIYVSSKGKDSNDGTRFKPFKTIERALEYINQTERKVLYLTDGEFMLDSILELETDITITGGFSSEVWTPGPSHTIINISKRLSGNLSMINIHSGNINLNKITLSNANLNAPMITMTGGALLLNKVKLFHANGKTSVSLEIKNADLTIKDTELIFGPISEGNLINAKNSSIFLENTIIKGTGNSGTLKILSLEKTKIDITNSIIVPSLAKKIEVISSVNSKLNINSSSFDTGTASIYSNLFVLKESDLIMEKSGIASNNLSRIFSGFDIVDSNLEIDNCTFDLKAESGISFIRMLNSSLELSNTEISAYNTNEFLYLLKGNTSIINFNNNKISTKTTDIFTGFESSNCVSIFRDNEMSFDGGATIFSAFTFKRPLNIEFTNNKLISSNISWISSENQVAFNIAGVKDSVSIMGNNIYGWKSVLKHNDIILKSVEELNNYRGFLDIPEDNYSRKD